MDYTKRDPQSPAGLFNVVRMARVELAQAYAHLWCGWRESNSHRLTPTTPSKWRVYHFTTSAFGLGLQRYIDFI